MLEPLTTTPIKLAKVKKALAATFLTILLATTCYAATIYLATITSPQVEVARINGFFEFSKDNATGWTIATDYYQVTDMAWYVRFNVTSAYVGSVNVTWTLQYWNGNTWLDTNITVLTSNVHLDGANQTIYASSNGTSDGNRNWADTDGVWHQDLIPYAYFRIKIDFWQS